MPLVDRYFVQVNENEDGGDNVNASDESESDEQYLIRTKKVAPGHPNYLRTLRLSASHEVKSPIISFAAYVVSRPAIAVFALIMLLVLL